VARNHAQNGGDVQSVLEHHDYRYRDFALVEFLKYENTRRRMEKKENRIRFFGEDIQYAIVPLGCAR
jgi:hypothetical protein